MTSSGESVRAAIRDARRVVVKVGSSSLTLRGNGAPAQTRGTQDGASVLAGVSAHTHGRFAFFLPEGHEYHVMLIVVAIAIVLVGPGRYGLDGDRGWARRPFIGSFAALLLGIAGGVAMWVFLNGANPLG